MSPLSVYTAPIERTAATNEDLVPSILSLLEVAHDLVVRGAVAVGSKNTRMIDREEVAYMTGPMKFVKSVTGPTLSFATSARSCSLKPAFQTVEET